MADFSPADAAFEGFRLTREHPAVIPPWAILGGIASTAFLWAMLSSGYLQAMMAIQAKGGQPDPAELIPAATALMGRLTLVLPLALIIETLIQTAIVRMVLRPSERSIGYVRLGADELRVFAARLMVAIGVGAYCLAGLMVMSLAAAGGVAGAVLLFPIMLAFFAGLFALLVRLSLTTAATFATKQIGIRASWTLTKGRFWKVVSAYGIAVALYLVVITAGAIIGQVVILAFGPVVDMATVTAFAQAMTPGQIASIVIGAIFGALGIAILHAPAAVIYRSLTKGPAEVF